jgi:hypothetical protein
MTRPDQSDEPRRTKAEPTLPRTSSPNFLPNHQGSPSRWPRGHPAGAAHPNTGRTFGKAWKGGWGVLGDPRSKIAKLARKIERTELAGLYNVEENPEARELLKEACEWRAIERMERSRLGEPGASTRKASSASRVAAAKIVQLERLGVRVDALNRRPTSGAELIERAIRDGLWRPSSSGGAP